MDELIVPQLRDIVKENPAATLFRHCEIKIEVN